MSNGKQQGLRSLKLSLLLSGALLTWLLMSDVGAVVLGDWYHKLAGAEAWAAFLFASYLFGHLVFLIQLFNTRFDRANVAVHQGRVAIYEES